MLHAMLQCNLWLHPWPQEMFIGLSDLLGIVFEVFLSSNDLCKGKMDMTIGVLVKLNYFCKVECKCRLSFTMFCNLASEGSGYVVKLITQAKILKIVVID